MLALSRLPVGAYEANCYLLEDRESNAAALIDPGAQPEKIVTWVGSAPIKMILITHGHSDHVGALDELRGVLSCPVGGHASDAETFGLEFDFTLESGSRLEIGAAQLEVYEVPGHTEGSLAFALRDPSFERAIVGDAIFPGGPGHTQSHEDLKRLLAALEATIFSWPDEIRLYPGHGEATTVGAERLPFERMMGQDLPLNLFGDVTWR
jgi:glyoxylase-like metal-dependent hydrolase (beta-lactamase superfamily II)